MGQKVNPTGIRLKIVNDWDSVWYSGEDKKFSDYVVSDWKVRQFLNKALAEAGVASIKIERPAKNARITIYAARPGIVIGQKGREVETLRADVAKLMGVPVNIKIEEVRKPDLSAKLVAETVAKQLEQRVMFRKSMKRAVSAAMRAGAKGIKICVSGRLGGAEIARSEGYREGRVPLHTFRANIDYALAEANTTYGIIGVKVWIFKEEKLGSKKGRNNVAATKADGAARGEA